VSRRRPGARLVTAAALVTGACLGVAAASGTALLLYTGQGFLRAAGFLLSVSILGVAAGLWVGPPHAPTRRGPAGAPWSGPRWLGAVLAAGLAAGAAAVWTLAPGLRLAAPASALAVLLVLAGPAYAIGALLAALQSRGVASGGRSVAPAAVAGIALGVLVGTTLLIPRVAAPGAFLLVAAVLAAAGGLEARHIHTLPAERRHRMDGKVALVTGAGDPAQVAQAVAERFLAGGAALVLVGRSEAVLARAAELERRGGRVVGVVSDLATDAGAEAAVAAAAEHFGALHAVVNVAGGLRVIAPVADTDSAAWSAELERNAGTVLRVCRSALPMLRQSRGAIVNFASPAGLRAVPRMGAYSAAKAAVVALTRALALEEAESGVRVNAVAPGMVDTAQNRQEAGPDARFVSRAAVADVAYFLASEAARGVTGETLGVTGREAD